MAFGKPERGDCNGCGNNTWMDHKRLGLCRPCNVLRKEEKKRAKHGGRSKGSSLKRKATGEAEVFRKIWGARKRVSFLSNRSVAHIEEGSSFWYNLFAHLLPKRKYKSLRLEPKNIIILHPEEHSLLDQGTEEQREAYAEKWRCDWGKVYREREKMLQRLV